MSGTHRPASVIIPAHNEESSIRRLLDVLAPGSEPSELDIVVVCNGCTDNTAELARLSGLAVRVVEIGQASKWLAMVEGRRQARHEVQVYLDADVVISRTDVRTLVGALSDPVMAVAPARQLDRQGVSRLVSWYFDVWEMLPQVQAGLFGRGVIAVSEAGHARVQKLPSVLSDDLAISEAFGSDERQIVADATVIIRLPRTVRALLLRRIRVTTGNAQLDHDTLRSPESKTSVAVLLRIIRTSPWVTPKVVVFVAVTLVASVAARRGVKRGDFETWLRDDSSRGE